MLSLTDGMIQLVLLALLIKTLNSSACSISVEISNLFINQKQIRTRLMKLSSKKLKFREKIRNT